MSKIKTFVSLAACRLSRRAIRLLGRGGTDYPGRIALRVDPELLGLLAKDVTTVIVTGTNGKTTTSRMIEQMMKDAGFSYFANKSGANLLSGITAEFAMNSGPLGGRLRDFAVIECDEAAFKQVSRFVDAKYVVVTNVFRDQLDRYGEVTHTLENIRAGLENSPNATVCINADCSLCASLRDSIKNPVLFFGLDCEIYRERVSELSDAPYCIKCKSEYRYDYVTYGHLGSYSCPSCGWARPAADVAVSRVIRSDDRSSTVVMRVGSESLPVDIALPGGYNIYNAAACMCLARAMGLDAHSAAESLADFECGFGRMEEFQIKDTSLRMILIKNPAGCNQVLNFLANMSSPARFVVCLNDRAADGTDISWIWDADFERLLALGDKLTEIIVSGVRADDMALRFKYAGFGHKLRVIRDYDELTDELLSKPGPVCIMPTYTAMLDLRERISRRFGFKDFWE